MIYRRATNYVVARANNYVVARANDYLAGAPLIIYMRATYDLQVRQAYYRGAPINI